MLNESLMKRNASIKLFDLIELLPVPGSKRAGRISKESCRQSTDVLSQAVCQFDPAKSALSSRKELSKTFYQYFSSLIFQFISNKLIWWSVAINSSSSYCPSMLEVLGRFLKAEFSGVEMCSSNIDSFSFKKFTSTLRGGGVIELRR